MTPEEIRHERAKARVYYAANKEKACAQQRVRRDKYREEINARRREKARRLTPKERQLLQARRRAYYDANRDEILKKGRAYAAANKNTTKIKKNQLWQKFKITLEDWEQMYSNQGGVCSICGKKCRTGKDLSVDHNHETGKVRSLLCGSCNTGLGMFQDNSKLLIMAAKYLIDHEN